MAYLGRGIENLSDRVVLDSLTASATASYTLQLNSVNFVPSSAESLTVSLNGVIQAPNSSYTVSSSTITFASSLSASDSIDFIIAERGITLQTPSAGSVGTSQLASTAVTPAKMDLSQDYTFTGKVSGHNYPAFFAHLSAEQTVSNATYTKLQCDTEIIDVGGYYDNSTNYRYTPLVAGKYFVFGAIHLDATGGNYVDGQVEVRKNGTKVKYIAGRPNTSVNRGTEFTQTVSGIIDMNGSSDYIELWGYLNANSGSTDFEDDFGTSFGAYRIGD